MISVLLALVDGAALPRLALATGVAAAAILLALSAINLTGQGLYYDEVHQATAAFAYLPSHPPVAFSSYEVAGIPVLNMPYSGALKTAVYGLYLRLHDGHFTVINWRLTGIIFAALGLLSFAALSKQSFPYLSLIIFLVFCVTDTTVILTSRHDWGPVALGFMIRMIFIALLIRAELSSIISKKTAFAIGLLTGIAVFEKLSSVVLVLPLILMLSYSVGRRSVEPWLASILGVVIGIMPLIIANTDSFLQTGTLISFGDENHYRELSFERFPGYMADYLSLGNGELAKQFVLNANSGSLYARAEPFLLMAILFLLAGTLRAAKCKRLRRASSVMLLSYVLVSIELYPLQTWVHHWVLGTPFQYAAIALGATAALDSPAVASLPHRVARVGFLGLVALLLAFHLSSTIGLVASLLRGDTATSWDPSLTRLGEFAAKHAEESVFIAAEWGTANQIRVLVDGRTDVVYEAIWDYRGEQETEDAGGSDMSAAIPQFVFMRYLRGPKHITDTVSSPEKRVLYLLLGRPRINWRPASVEQIVRDVEGLPGFQETFVDQELGNIAGVEVRKFVRGEQVPPA